MEDFGNFVNGLPRGKEEKSGFPGVGEPASQSRDPFRKLRAVCGVPDTWQMRGT